MGLSADIEKQETHSRKFELPGSAPHYPPSLLFTISHMQLSIEPDFDSRTIECRQLLQITMLRDIEDHEICLDAAELNIKSVSSKSAKLDFLMYDDKLVIKLPNPLQEKRTLELAIAYQAKPRKGFYFVGPDKYYPKKNLQAWTQGETTESKYWFPCLDHPQVKFSSEISVTVPFEFAAISNGRLIDVSVKQNGTKSRKKTFNWSEAAPNPAYLTSVVIGRFVEIKEKYGQHELLYYYVPQDRRKDADRSFEHTPQMMKFFEEYLDTKYPYNKYSQAAVEDFVYGGMENSSCTTLTIDTLHDRKAHLDFTSDHLISHELAHQWFGDLVTCRDWQHIWLNEAFATYGEALYWEASRGIDEFQYYIIQIADDYFEETTSRYVRPIVTKVYKNPDELFDRHSYEKGGCVLHMLRNHIGDKYFRRALKTYLQKYAHGTVETEDLRKILEQESGSNLQQFFDQWVYRPGHPELKVEFSIDSPAIDSSRSSSSTSVKRAAKIKIEQTHHGDPFEFPLDIKLVYPGKRGKRREERFTFNVSDKETVFQIPFDKHSELDWFSLDPEFKLIKKVSLKSPKEMLIRQLEHGITIFERVDAARALKEYSSENVIEALKGALLGDRFWGICAEAAKSLGSIKTDEAYEALKKCLYVKHPKIRRAVVRALGEFKGKRDLIKLVKPVLHDQSYFVEAEAATTIGKSKQRVAIPLLRKAIETNSFQNVVAQGAIAGLKEFQGDKQIATLLIQKSRHGVHHRIREAATFALGKFIDGNPNVFHHLKGLLTDKWFRVRINACRAFADAEEVKSITDLTWVAEHDLDNRVRRIAEECINLIKEVSKKPKEIAQMREEVDKIKATSLEIMQKMDRIEREVH